MKSPPFGGRGKSYYRPKGAGSDSKDSIRTLKPADKEAACTPRLDHSETRNLRRRSPPEHRQARSGRSSASDGPVPMSLPTNESRVVIRATPATRVNTRTRFPEV